MKSDKPDEVTPLAAYKRSHTAAVGRRQSQLFQDIFHDPTIVPPAPVRRAESTRSIIRSKEGWTIVELIEKPHAPVAEMKVWVVTGKATKGDTQPADDFEDAGRLPAGQTSLKRDLLPALGVALALAGCGHRPAPPDAAADAGHDGGDPRTSGPAGPPPSDAGGGWTPEALEQAQALAREFAAETHPCFYRGAIERMVSLG